MKSESKSWKPSKTISALLFVGFCTLAFVIYGAVVSIGPRKSKDVPNGLIRCDVVRVLEMKEKEGIAVPDSYDNPIAVGGYYHWSRRMDCSFAPIDLSGNRGINIGVFNDMAMARDTLRVLTCYKATALVLEVYYFKDSIQVSRHLGNGVHFK